MSSTNRKIRTGTDTYYTPAYCTHRIIEALPQLPGGVWCDAGAGNGEILKAVKSLRDDIVWVAIELREECEESLEAAATVVHIGDFLEVTPQLHRRLLSRVSHLPKYSVLVMNPPFRIAFEFLQKALEIADYVVMLQRINFLGSRERSDFFRADPPDLYVLPDRPSFTGGQGDSIEYGWFVFGPERSRRQGALQILAKTPIEERGGRRVSKRSADESAALPEASTTVPEEVARLAEMEASAAEEHREPAANNES